MKINKPIYLVTADIYLRFPEIMEEEIEELTEYLEDEHIVYEGATDVVYDLQKENFKLQARCDRLENNWNKLKECLKEEIATIKTNFSQVNGNYFMMNDRIESLEDILTKMQEIKDKFGGEM